jgi:serine O-acetyltransferase
MSDLTANTGKSGLLWAVFYLIFHPGYLAIMLHRLAHMLHRYGIIGKALSKIVWRANVHITQCQISPLAQIGPDLRLPHAFGIVIGEGVVIGRDVTLLHNVTLGKKKPEENAYPTLEDNVSVMAGACVLDSITIGHNATIGAMAVVLENVPAGAIVAGNPARIISSVS